MISRRSYLGTLTGVIVVAVVLGVLLPWLMVSAQEPLEPELPTAGPATDTVTFDAALRAADKPAEVVEQYAWTSVNGQILHNDSSTGPQQTDSSSYGTSGDACVSVGPGAGCDGVTSVSSAMTTNGSMDTIEEENRLLVSLVSVGAAVTENMTTGVRCAIDEDGLPTGEAQRPTGEISYGGTALLGASPEEEINFADISTNRFEDQVQTGVLGGLVAPLFTGVEINLDSGWDGQALRAYSEVTVTYAIGGSLLSILGGTPLQERTFTARSECGMLMSDGTGSTAPAGVSPQAFGAPRGLRLAEPEAPETTDSQARPTTAPGAPQATGFTDEISLTTDDGGDYHLLSTRELGLLDREHILDVFAATREAGAVEGETAAARWWLYSAEAASEQVPVLEIELVDATIVQVRPNAPGVQHPVPDGASSETQPGTTQRPTTEQPPAPTPEPTAQPPAEPTSGSAPTTSTESEEGTGDG